MRKILTVLLVFAALCGSAQKKDELKIVDNFVKAVFFDKLDNKAIIDQYFVLPSKDVLPMDQSRKIISSLVDSLRKDKTATIASGKYIVRGYSNYSGDKLKFNNDQNSIYLVLVDNKPAIYIYAKNQKIASFVTENKGDSSFFITLSAIND